MDASYRQSCCRTHVASGGESDDRFPIADMERVTTRAYCTRTYLHVVGRSSSSALCRVFMLILRLIIMLPVSETVISCLTWMMSGRSRTTTLSMFSERLRSLLDHVDNSICRTPRSSSAAAAPFRYLLGETTVAIIHPVVTLPAPIDSASVIASASQKKLVRLPALARTSHSIRQRVALECTPLAL